MNKVPFVIIGILLVTAIFVAVFSTGEGKNPLATLVQPTPTPPLKINFSNPADQQKAQQQALQGQNQQQAVQGQQTQQAAPTGKQVEAVSATTGVIKTEKGDIEIEFYPTDAPRTVINFATLAKYGYYNGLTFHRVEPGFVIQGGDPNGNGSGGYSIYGPTFEDELNPDAASYQTGYLEGVVAMANRGPNTNGSQFFIMLADNLSLPKNYTIFGKVTKGMEVVKKIAKGDKMTTVEVK